MCGKVCTSVFQNWQLSVKIWICTFPIGDPHGEKNIVFCCLFLKVAYNRLSIEFSASAGSDGVCPSGQSQGVPHSTSTSPFCNGGRRRRLPKRSKAFNIHTKPLSTSCLACRRKKKTCRSNRKSVGWEPSLGQILFDGCARGHL